MQSIFPNGAPLPLLLGVAAVFAYLCGCFNGAVIVSKYILRNDVRNHGSGQVEVALLEAPYTDGRCCCDGHDRNYVGFLVVGTGRDNCSGVGRATWNKAGRKLCCFSIG